MLNLLLLLLKWLILFLYYLREKLSTISGLGLCSLLYLTEMLPERGWGSILRKRAKSSSKLISYDVMWTCRLCSEFWSSIDWHELCWLRLFYVLKILHLKHHHRYLRSIVSLWEEGRVLEWLLKVNLRGVALVCNAWFVWRI